MSTAEYQKEWRSRNPGKAAEYNRKYRLKYPDRLVESRAKEKSKYILKGKFPFCRVSKEQQKINNCLYARKWRDSNREKVRESSRKSYVNNREMHRLHSINYKSRVRAGRDGTIGYKILLELQIKQVNKCAICTEELGDYKELDHVIPISKGGKHSISNVQWTCRSCNRSKRDNII